MVENGKINTNIVKEERMKNIKKKICNKQKNN